MQVFVNDEFLSYFATFFGQRAGDPYYVPEFDFNRDGVIDILDQAVVAQAYGGWLNIGGPDFLFTIAAAAGGLALGYLLSRVL